eukprot:TRINITY_DN11628_c0_g1_i1.p1 TRINITY_DN11628_c0_g1~~TRINITY_DN11628_c0_g1_i1.p1  ORF type:complete len:212 (+),score=46.58 TRINITY_DN11628_c0_g1_i1:90-725(+)
MSHASISEASRLRFVNSRLSNGTITSKANPGVNEIKIPGAGEKSVEALANERIVTYYQLIATLFAQNWNRDDLKEFLKRVGMAPSYIDTVLVLVWNHLRLAEIEGQPLRGADAEPGAVFQNGRLIVKGAKKADAEEDVVVVPFLSAKDLELLEENDIRTFYELVGRCFYCGWRKQNLDKHFGEIGLAPATIARMSTYLRTQLRLDELEGSG